MKPVLEGGAHAEVSASPTKRPQQVRVLVLGGDQESTVGGDHIGRDQVVAGKAEAA
jgi:hypothetical protein